MLSLAQQVKIISFDELEKRFSRKNDTTYVVNLWATWCKPCVAELEHFVRLGEEFKNQKIKVLLVSLDFKSGLETSVKPFLRKRNMNMEIYLLDEPDPTKYIDRFSTLWSGAIPCTLMINETKQIREFHEKEFQWEELRDLYVNLKSLPSK